MKNTIAAIIIVGVLLAGCAIRTPGPTATSTQVTFEPTATTTPSAEAPTVAPTSTPTPTITPSPTATPTATPIPIHPVGTIVTHEPSEDIPYMWFSYVPGGLSKDATVYVLITGLHGEMASYEKAALTSQRMLEERLAWPYIDEFALLVPVIPRRDTPHVYPVAFDLQNFHESDEFYKRADLKVNLMIERLTSDLTKDGYQVSNKVLIEGYSAGGMFAQRYALLHPARVKAIAAGHCGGNFTLPESSYQGEALNWPVGVNNLQTLTGFELDRDSYMEIAQFIYIGDLDTGEGGTSIVWSRDWGPQYMWESVDQLDFLNSHFGETNPVRLQNQIEYLNSIGYVNIELRLYPGVGHGATSQMVQDIMMFFDAQRQGGPSAEYGGIVVLPSPTPGPAPTLPIVIDGNAQDWSAMTPVLEDEEGDSLAGEDMDLTAMYLAQDANYVFLMLRTAAALTEEQAEVDLWLDLLPGSHCDQSEVGLSFHPDDTVGAWDSTVCGRINPLGIVGALVRWGDVLEARIPRASLGEHEHIIPVTVRLNTPFNGEWNSADVIP